MYLRVLLDKFPVRYVGRLMKPSVEFAPYPLAREPRYSRWLCWGVLLVGAVAGGMVALHPLVEARRGALVVLCTALGWCVLFIVDVLRYRFNRHNAQCYASATARQSGLWWHKHRQSAGLAESVLLSPACTRPEQVAALLSLDHEPFAQPRQGEPRAIRMPQLIASDPVVRECELAVLLALQWQAARVVERPINPIRCYWQGSPAAWQAFRQQLLQCSPTAVLPEQAEAWQGLDSLEAIIDELQEAPAGCHFLCAGSHCAANDGPHALPAGEAAVLWLLGASGPVRLSRGEWLGAQAHSLSAVADRALQQSSLDKPVQACMAFSPGGNLDLADTAWNMAQRRLDLNFGALDKLQALVVQTLAAWHAMANGEPCGWLATDPHYSLILGVAKPDDASE